MQQYRVIQTCRARQRRARFGGAGKRATSPAPGQNLFVSHNSRTACKKATRYLE
jgi:hypothetical protein